MIFYLKSLSRPIPTPAFLYSAEIVRHPSSGASADGNFPTKITKRNQSFSPKIRVLATEPKRLKIVDKEERRSRHFS